LKSVCIKSQVFLEVASEIGKISGALMLNEFEGLQKHALSRFQA
jgi:hypothetical protein